MLGVAATCHRGEEVSDGTVVWVGDARAPKKGHGRHFARAQRTFSLVARRHRRISWDSSRMDETNFCEGSRAISRRR